MILDRHWWRTADGRLVPDGHPDAAVLAYPRHTEIPDDVARKLGIAAEPEAKERRPGANKARGKSGDK